MAAKGYFYHVSENTRWEHSVWLKPRVVNRADGDEPTVPRICVAPTVAGCFVGACYTEGYKRVYRTKHKVWAVEPYNVYDSKITGEMWLLEPTEFVLIHDFSEEEVKEFPKSFDHFTTNRGMLLSQRAAKNRLMKHFRNIEHTLPRAQWI